MAEDDLEREAAQRRERLRALRAAVELVGPEDQPAQEPQEEDKEQQPPPPEQDIRFRNYIPRDKQLQPSKVTPPTIPKFDDPVASAPVANGTEDPFVSIAPKKANWDLRRDVAKKLEKLERRTQRALIELMQEEEKRRQELAADGQLVEDD